MECPAKYYHRYINKPEGIHIPLEEPFIKGNLAHSCIEEFLLHGANKEDVIETVIPIWIQEKCLLPVARSDDELKRLEGVDADEVIRYAKSYGKLLHRCIASYVAEDRIRNNDGGIPADPFKYPPNGLKQLYKQQGLGELKMSIDNLAAMLSTQFRRLSLADIAAIGVACFYNFHLPEWIEEVTGIEYTSDDKIPWDDGSKEWAWFVDMKYKTTDGSLVISDHKTSKEKPSGVDVAFHPQLNLYAYLNYEETGKFPEYLAINHLPSGEMIVAETDVTIVHSTVKHLKEIQGCINACTESNCFPGRTPQDFNSPCISRDWKTKAVTKVCPYLPLCHTRYADYIKPEIVDYLNLDE